MRFAAASDILLTLMQLCSLWVSLVLVMLAGCANGTASRAPSASARDDRARPSTIPPPVSRPSPEDAQAVALVAEVNASSVGDCSVEYQSSGDGSGSGLIEFHGAERHLPPSPPGPPAQITSHASLRTERYQSPANVDTAARKRQAEFEACMRERPNDDRARKGMSLRGEACRVSFLPDLPTAHYEGRFSVVRTDSSGDRFVIPEECKDALAKLEARLTPYASSR
jgi:hypothetical protein